MNDTNRRNDRPANDDDADGVDGYFDNPTKSGGNGAGANTTGAGRRPEYMRDSERAKRSSQERNAQERGPSERHASDRGAGQHKDQQREAPPPPPRESAERESSERKPAGEAPTREQKPRENYNELPPGWREARGAQSMDLDDLATEDIENRRGNYLFTVGVPGSGKSVFQSHLLRFLDQGGRYNYLMTDPVDPTGAQAARVQDTIKVWRDAWMDNRFPPRTQKSRPSEFRFRIEVIDRSWPETDFGFFEVSGEDFRKFTLNGPDDSVLESLRKFLGNKQCHFVFALVCIGHAVREDDRLFSAFLDYLRKNFDDHYLRHSRVLIVISDPEQAAKLLARKRGGSSKILDRKAFVDEFLPGTATRLRAWKSDFAMAQFEVGEIKVDPATKEEYIERPVFDDARVVMDWIYEAFTGRDPNERPLIDRIMGLFGRMG